MRGLSLRARFVWLDRLRFYAGDESVSGVGSSLAATEVLRTALPPLLYRHRVRSLLDLPCGDMHWMSRVDLDGIEYVGADIVPRIIAGNRRRHAAPGRRFEVLDATRDPLPAVDLVWCRDLLIHLSLDDIRRVLANVSRSGSRLLMASHFGDRHDNTDIVSGEFRPVNLCRPPFGLPPPIERIDERGGPDRRGHPDKAMALWRVHDLPRSRG